MHEGTHIDDGKLTGVLFIDLLSKAFDTVNHKILYKLKSVGICDNSLLWVKLYICNRQQSVSWNGILSFPKNIYTGVPQGFILGHLLSILNINDYPKCLKYSHVTIYADDTSQDVSDKSIDTIEYKLEAGLVNSMQWMKRNKL